MYLIVFDFTRFRCAENGTPQDHFRCVMVCYRTCTPQKTRPRSERFFFFFFEILASTHGPGPYRTGPYGPGAYGLGPYSQVQNLQKAG